MPAYERAKLVSFFAACSKYSSARRSEVSPRLLKKNMPRRYRSYASRLAVPRGAAEAGGGAAATVVAAGVGADAVLPDSSGETAATIADEISSCILNTSLDSRSNMSDQTVNPSVVFTRRAV